MAGGGVVAAIVIILIIVAAVVAVVVWKWYSLLQTFPLIEQYNLKHK